MSIKQQKQQRNIQAKGASLNAVSILKKKEKIVNRFFTAIFTAGTLLFLPALSLASGAPGADRIDLTSHGIAG
ncbi:MAG: hypothetical protein KKA54_11320 [Proteobacteria bacterium]|nr:hypothetical protein [Pseudomonadota bacterium]